MIIQCRIGQEVLDDCCWGGRGGDTYLASNEAACNDQKNGFGNPDNICYDGGEAHNHCANNDLTEADCVSLVMRYYRPGPIADDDYRMPIAVALSLNGVLAAQSRGERESARSGRALFSSL